MSLSPDFLPLKSTLKQSEIGSETLFQIPVKLLHSNCKNKPPDAEEAEKAALTCL